MPIAAERDGERIAVEVKSFLGPSDVTDLERALGQYALYLSLLRVKEPGRVLYIAVPKLAFESFVGLPSTLAVIRDWSVKLIVFEPEKEVIVSWLQ
ncbi:MAG TPA: element excision factor XisH family protein [Candidatus Xenobia bacterium]|jgi:hypothetical protein